MKFGIIGALDEEVRLLRESMIIEKETSTYGTTFIEGSYNGCPMVIVTCGVGTINAAVCASTIIREFGAEAVINIGVAGSLSREMKVMDVVLSEDVIFHDADRSILKKFYPHCESFKADKKLIDLCTTALDSIDGRSYDYKLGRIATGDYFISSTEEKNKIISDVNPLCVEMEGASIAQVAVMNDVPFLIIRAMSDNADEDADESFDTLLERAAKHSSQLMLRMLELYS